MIQTLSLSSATSPECPTTTSESAYPAEASGKKFSTPTPSNTAAPALATLGAVEAEPIGWNGRPYSANMQLPPFGVVFFRPARDEVVEVEVETIEVTGKVAADAPVVTESPVEEVETVEAIEEIETVEANVSPEALAAQALIAETASSASAESALSPSAPSAA